jgi:hypothetical protein
MDALNPSNPPLPPLMREGGELAPAAVAALCEHPFAELCERWVAHDLACWSRVAHTGSRDLGIAG